MADKRSQMLPASRPEPFVMPSLDMKTSGQRLYERNHADQTNRAFADAMVVNFPQSPSLLQRRNDYAQILTGQGLPIEQAMAEAEAAIPDAAPVQPPAGSQLPPITAPADLGALGRNGDTMVAHINPEEAALLKAHGGSGTINPRTGLPEFSYNDRQDSATRAGGLPGGGGSRSASKGSAGGSKPGRSIYDDIKIADPVTEKILNPDPYGGILTEKNGHVYSTGNDDQAYNDAIDKWSQRTFADRLANFFAPGGLTSVKPTYGRPATYAGGDFHTGINPAGAIVGLAAGMALPGAGLLAGPAASAAYDAFGGQKPILTGPRTIYADDGTGGTARPGTDVASQGGNPAPGGDRTGNTGGGPALLPPLTGGQGGNPSSGSLLPPIAAPVQPSPQSIYPGAYMPVAGPSAYGWTRPSWPYRA